MIKLVIFDLDGTLFRGSEAIPGAVEAVDRLRASGVQVRFLTNNSAHSSVEIAQRLNGLGFQAEESEVLGTAPFAVAHCDAAGFKSVFLIGEPGLRQAFEEGGIPTQNESVDAVVVGICRSFDYAMCDAALQHLRQGATFIATNRDATYPVEGGREQPGAGAMVAAIAAASGREPEVLGKPNPAMILELIRSAETTVEQTLVVGDRMETDIEAGARAGAHTLLVLSGATKNSPTGTRSLGSVGELTLDWLRESFPD